MFKKLRINTSEITLIALFISLALMGKYVDRFIPHVHPFQILFLVIGVSFLGFYKGMITLNLFILLNYLFFGIRSITAFMIVMHIIAIEILIIVSIIKYLKMQSRKMEFFIIWILIIITMTLHLLCIILGDSDYSPKSIELIERMYLALMWPGDGLNILVTMIIVLMVVPISLKTLSSIDLFNKY